MRENFSVNAQDLKSPASLYYDAIVSFLLSLAILSFRKPDSFTNARLCFEDGPVFFGQAITFGWRSITVPYAGYYHAVPRLIAILLNAIIPPQNMALSYNIAAGIVAAIVSVAISFSRFDFKMKWFFSIILFLMPHGGEVFLFLTDIQWIIAPYFMLLCIQDRDPKLRFRFIQPIFVFLMAVTGPFSIFLLPFFFIRVVIYRNNRNELILFFTIAIAALIQSYSILTHHFAKVGEFGDWPLVPEWIFWGVIAPLFGYPDVPRLVVRLLFLTTAIPLVVCFVQLETKWRVRFYAMVLFSGSILLAGLIRVGDHQIQLVSPFISGGERYFFIPYAMIGWGLFILAAKASRSWRLVGALALLVIFAVNSGRFTARPLSDSECYTPSIVGQGPTSPKRSTI